LFELYNRTYSDKLKNDFPEKIIEYYFKLALYDVENGANRKSYVTSMKYFKKAKEIYLDILDDKPRWESKLTEIKARYNKRKAFMEESRVLD
jgi:methionine synthase II (cobalamin-independent)